MLKKLFVLCVILAIAMLFYKQILDKAQEYVDQNTEKEWAPRAQYWIGYTYFFAHDYPLSSNAFSKVLKKYPKSDYASESQFMLARIWESLENYKQARIEYEKFIEAFPQHALVKKARQKIDIFSLIRDEPPK